MASAANLHIAVRVGQMRCVYQVSFASIIKMWQLTLFKIRDDLNFGCRVEREGGRRSYLMFYSFLLKADPKSDVLSGTAWVRATPLLAHFSYYRITISGLCPRQILFSTRQMVLVSLFCSKLNFILQ
ncbi:hypothetical protein CLF_100704 [Clonorchis sinensis]|uniref:Uncharacterized protein n=1 Tax=Clonorchis sinensis TaxID=79923 RepID=G7Y420_CLOSI|nr:hypothetical protein CLF_100704 [Clonorchis sinensis]